MQGLEACGLFQGLSDKELQAAGKQFAEVSHPAGKEVMVRGAGGVGFMVILDGEAEVTTTDGRKRTLSKGAFFGEMALLDHEGRSATVTAKTPLRLAALPEWSFKTFMLGHPEVLYRLLETLSHRLREREQG
jgi:CRP-like cAMP-binding protein